MNKKQITGRMFVRIHGEDIPWETLEYEKKEEISEALVDRIMQAMGYRRKEEQNRKGLEMDFPEERDTIAGHRDK